MSIRFPIKRSGQGRSSEYVLTKDKYMEYMEAYPGLDIQQHLRVMRQWCIDNPSKRKTEKGIHRFINNWLSGEFKKLKPYSTRSRSLSQDLNDRSWAQ